MDEVHLLRKNADFHWLLHIRMLLRSERRERVRGDKRNLKLTVSRKAMCSFKLPFKRGTMLKKRLTALNDQLREMAALCRKMVEDSIRALEERDTELARCVSERDEVTMNQMETWNLEEAVRVIALFQPNSKDLRRLVAAILINRDLERVGDHAENISDHAVYLSDHPETTIPEDLKELAGCALNQLEEALRANDNGDEELARRVMVGDLELNRMTGIVIEELQTSMNVNCADPACSKEPWMRLILVARHLERIGDHATNIAESVLFVVESHLHLHRKHDVARELGAKN